MGNDFDRLRNEVVNSKGRIQISEIYIDDQNVNLEVTFEDNDVEGGWYGENFVFTLEQVKDLIEEKRSCHDASAILSNEQITEFKALQYFDSFILDLQVEKQNQLTDRLKFLQDQKKITFWNLLSTDIRITSQYEVDLRIFFGCAFFNAGYGFGSHNFTLVQEDFYYILRQIYNGAQPAKISFDKDNFYIYVPVDHIKCKIETFTYDELCDAISKWIEENLK